MPRIKAKPVVKGSRTIQKPVIQKAVIRKAVAEKEIARKEIIAALRSAARKLRCTPSRRELGEISGISMHKIARYFQTYRNALAAAGIMPNQSGRRIEMAVLMADWGKVVRKVGGVPSQGEYLRFGSYSIDCLSRRVQKWRNVSTEFCRFVAAGGLAGDWSDVLEKIQYGPIPNWNERRDLPKRREAARLACEARARRPLVTKRDADETQLNVAMLARPIPSPLAGKKLVTATMLAVFIAELAPTALQWITGACFPRRVLEDRPLLGAAIQLPGLAHEPVNEMGVILLFGMVARQLGFIVESVQAGFPDCEARMEVYPGRWQRVRIEFEYESRSFRQHNHDAAQCDLIICWRHNWKGCPAKLQVLELSRMMGSLTTDNTDQERQNLPRRHGDTEKIRVGDQELKAKS